MLGRERAQAQTYSEMYTVNASNMPATLVMDRGGRLYGVANGGSDPHGCAWFGMVFQLKASGSNWLLNPLHCFTAPLGGNDGAEPIDYGGLTFGPDGNIYGTTNEGGINNGTNSLGTVFKLSPPQTVCVTALCPWTTTILYKFMNSPDGAFPMGNVVFDSAGSMYGTTEFGGAHGNGAVFKLARSGGTWTESVIYSFSGSDGLPQAGLAIDSAGNLYGTAFGQPGGNVFQLSPTASGWVENVIYRFNGGTDGTNPLAGVVLDGAGNLYGATHLGGVNNGGTIYELSPSSNGWTFHVLYSLAGNGGPQSTLTMDSGGNLYGTTAADGHSFLGNIFELSPGQGGWTYIDLHSYSLGDNRPLIAGVTVAPDGTLYGTAGGYIWKITR